MRAPVSLLALISLALGAVASPQEGVLAAEADCRSRPPKERAYLYYAVLSHFETGKVKQEWWQMTSANLNGTSRKAEIWRPPVLLRPKKAGEPIEEADGLLIKREDWDRAVCIRINILYYGYDRRVVERLALVEPHYHYRERDVQTVRVDVEKGKIEKVDSPKDDKAAGPPVFVFRNGFKQVKRSEVEAGEEVYERVSERGYRTIGFGPDATGAKSAAPAPAVRYEKRGGYTVPVRDPEPVKEAPKPEAPRTLVVHGAWLPAREIASLALMTGSDSPIALADWLWWQTSIDAEREPGPGYSDLLGFKDQDEFHLRVGFDPKQFRVKFEEFVREYRGAVGRSGVSKQPRRISVETTLGGRLWITFDNIVATGIRNPLEVPDDAFKFAATRQLSNLPNGWLAMGLFNDKGVKQAFAPTEAVGGDHTSTDLDVRIINGQCLRCHSEGIKPFKDWFKGMYKPPLEVASPDYEAVLDLQRKYNGRLERQIRPTVDLHAEAVKEACGLTLVQLSALITSCWKYVESDGVDMKRAARELGCTPADLQASWRAWKGKVPGKPLEPRGIHTSDIFLREEKDQEPIGYRQWCNCITDHHKALAAWKDKP